MNEPTDEDLEDVILISRLARLELALAALVDLLVDLISEHIEKKGKGDDSAQ